MKALVELGAVFFGTLVTLLTCFCLGQLALRPIKRELTTLERSALSFVVGSAFLGLLVFALGVIGVIDRIIYLLITISSVAACLHYRQSQVPSYQLKDSWSLPSRTWTYAIAAVCCVYGATYLVYALGPETSPDGTAYHLGLVARYFREGRIQPTPASFYSGLSQGLEMLFLFAYSFGGQSSAVLVHLAYLPTLAVLMATFGRRIGYPLVGIAAGIAMAVTPVVGIDASSAYNDIALACAGFSCFYLLTLMGQAQSIWIVFFAGCTAGFAYGIKYSGIGALVLGPLMILNTGKWKVNRSTTLKIAVFLASYVLVAGVWPLRSALWYGNPVAPLYNALFPNDFVHLSMELRYRQTLANWGNLPSKWNIPVEITLRGLALQGFLGPFFLLSGVALLALRDGTGRRLLMAALLFGLPYSQNIGTRFIIPALPFIVLSMFLVFAKSPRLILAGLLFHSIASLPPVSAMYCDPYAWRIHEFPWREALRIAPPDNYLAEKLSELGAIKYINASTPSSSRILALSSVAESYINREIVMGDGTAIGEQTRDSLWSAYFAHFQPSKLITLRCPPTPVRKVRIVSAGENEQGWGINEVRLNGPQGELPRLASWRLSALPNDLDVIHAFDNNPVTRWLTWGPVTKGMYIEVDLGRTETVTSLTLLTNGQFASHPVVAELLLDGRRTEATETVVSPPPVFNLPFASSQALKRAGISHLLVRDDGPLALDLKTNAIAWHLEQRYSDPSWTLYLIH